jgi:hypothetical protein
LEKESPYSIEFAHNRMYIYDDIHILEKENLIAMYKIAQHLLVTIGPLLDRLHDDFSALHPYFAEKPSASL